MAEQGYSLFSPPDSFAGGDDMLPPCDDPSSASQEHSPLLVDNDDMTGTIPSSNPTDPMLNNSCNNKTFGPAPFYRISVENNDDDDESEEVRSIPVHYGWHFRLRGEELKDMTEAEYSAIIAIKKPPREKSNK